MDRNKAVVYVAGLFTWGMLGIVRMVYLDGSNRPLVNFSKTSETTKKS